MSLHHHGFNLLRTCFLRFLQRKKLSALHRWKTIMMVQSYGAESMRKTLTGLHSSYMESVSAISNPSSIKDLAQIIHGLSRRILASDHICLLLVENRNLICEIENRSIDFDVGVIGYVARNGNTFSEKNVNNDSRFRDHVDLSKNLPRPNRYTRIDMVCVPIIDGKTGRIKAMLQATKFQEHKDEYDSDDSFVELCTMVLTVVARIVGSLLIWFEKEDRLKKLLYENETLFHDTSEKIKEADHRIGKLRNDRDKLQNRIKEMESSHKQSNKCTKTELQEAYERIADLEAQCSKTRRLEKEMKGAKKVLKEWDEREKIRSLMLPTTSLTSKNTLSELEKLEKEQKTLAKRVNQLRVTISTDYDRK